MMTRFKLFGKILDPEDASKEIEFQENRLKKYKECFITEAGQFVLADLMAQVQKRLYETGKQIPFQDVTYNLGAKDAVDEIVNTVEFNDQALKSINKIKTEIMKHERQQQFNASNGTLNAGTNRQLL